jgi:uncharacterized RDD family membrane protein YckC
MKRTTKNWISILIVAGMVCAQTQMLPAQSNDLENIVAQPSSAPASATNTVEPPSESAAKQWTQNRRGPVVSILGNAELKASDAAESVVAIGGSSRATGKVRNAVVAIGGDATADADVGDAVVAIGGNATAHGKVGDAVVAVAGDAEANGEVGDAVVAVMGNVRIGSNAVVNGDVVVVGGKVEVAEGAKIKGEIVEISAAQYPVLMPLKGAADWLRHCLLKFRLLAPQAGWYWIVVVGFLLFYMLIAVAAPRPVAACVRELTQRPATTFLMGLLTKLLLPLVLVVLAMTGIGMVVIPIIMAVVFVGSMIGKVALFEYIGGTIFRAFGVTVARPVLALLVGFVLITLFYMVPVISLLVYSLLGVWALGVVVTATFTSMRRETPPRTPPPSAMQSAPMPETSFTASAAKDAADNVAASQPTMSPPPVATNMPEAFSLHRANFFERIAAAFLDVIIVGILIMAVVHLVPPLRSMRPPQVTALVALAYFAGMWAWKGTTIGGTVLNLKVVRLDGKPVTFGVAVVRGLVSVLSVIVFFLGFFWMIWDVEKQTWHDKIAGTVVVRVPRGMPLVCL